MDQRHAQSINAAAELLSNSVAALGNDVEVDVDRTTERVVGLLEDVMGLISDEDVQDSLDEQIAILRRALTYPDSPEQAWREVSSDLVHLTA